MESNEIQQRVQNLTSRIDLLALINDLQDDYYGSRPHKHFTARQINIYCNPNIESGRYVHFEIPKKSGKEPRHITAPSRRFRSMLFFLNKILQAHYNPKPCVTGFLPGKSIVDNALLHTNKHYVFNIDLKDFFPSIRRERVWKKLQCPPFNFTGDRLQLANTIAGLCCMKTDKVDGQGCPIYVLPQGAPTSPILTNIICERLDWQLTGLAKRFNATYSRYADDITFSSMHNVYQKDGAFVRELTRIIEGQGFALNPDKTRLCRMNSRQEVTGLTVNTKVNVTRKYVEEVRHVLHRWEKDGYAVASEDFLRYYRREKAHLKCGKHMENIIEGKLNYLKMVKGDDDSTYKKLKLRFDSLYSNQNNRDSKSSVVPNNIAKDSTKQDESLSDTLQQLVDANFSNLEILIANGV